jgi:acetyl/propionyl-CoA carboxylase alpha subunit
MHDAGVPVLPGATVDAGKAPAAQQARGDGGGYPQLVKAAFGGGGRGMRIVAYANGLHEALAGAQREAAAAFGDGTVFLERFVTQPRHVEVQVVGDSFGTVAHLFERECSIQRRHQKIVEETPSTALDDDTRARMCTAAVAAASAIGYVNAGTVEFVLDADGAFWFLEVNTRLQVEHGVTELVSDVDIVREQLRIAAGAELSSTVVDAAAAATAPRRHAIEVRISAEDPARAFAPAPGRIGHGSAPAGPGVRVDAAVEAGERVPPDYDPLVAKLLVVDRTRDGAIDRLARALDEFEVTGIATTLPFHRFVARDPTFRAGDVSTDWVADRWDPAMAADRAAALADATIAAALTAAGEALPAATGVVSVRKDDPGAAPSSRWRTAARRNAVDRWPR